MRDEPKRHPLFLTLAGVLILASVPFLFVGKNIGTVLGFPGWLWLSLVLTVGLASLTAWAIFRYWRDDDLE
jgi:hypothetical protein